jgi:putative ABC transport system ATP-binding protein
VITADDATLSRFRNKKIGFIFQSFHLEPMRTAVASVMVPLLFADYSRSKAKQMALESLRLVGLADKSYHRTSQLSAGQCQRVAVARAIVNKPSILLADEPTGNLDVNTGRGIIHLLREINSQQGATVVLVTHDEEVASQARRRIEIEGGKVKSDSGEKEART